MLYNILALGDVTSEDAVRHVQKHLRAVQKLKNIHFTVINGENASGTGIIPAQADALFAAGADVITLGNHTWTRTELKPYLEERKRILRPANYGPQCPGRGISTFHTPVADILFGRLVCTRQKTQRY